MKKLNNKGFTLVELLAVIIILAIVVGITIPSITSVINNSKNSSLGIATESAYDYLKDQYDINVFIIYKFFELVHLYNLLCLQALFYFSDLETRETCFIWY